MADRVLDVTDPVAIFHSALATRRQKQFHLSDQELLIRQFHRVVGDTVAAYRQERS